MRGAATAGWQNSHGGCSGGRKGRRGSGRWSVRAGAELNLQLLHGFSSARADRGAGQQPGAPLWLGGCLAAAGSCCCGWAPTWLLRWLWRGWAACLVTQPLFLVFKKQKKNNKTFLDNIEKLILGGFWAIPIKVVLNWL